MQGSQSDAAAPSDLRIVLFYAIGQSSCGEGRDEQVIARALRARGLHVRIVDLADVALGDGDRLLLLDPHSGASATWEDPHAALMYHGAIAPPHSMAVLAEMERRGTVVINGPTSWPVFTDKAIFADYLGARGGRAIPTITASTPQELLGAIADVGGQGIVKQPVSTEGEGIFHVSDEASAREVADRLPQLGGRLIVQPLVDSRIGERIESGIARALQPGEQGRRHEFRLNTTRMQDGTIAVDAVYMRIAADDAQVVNNVAQGARPIAVAFTDLHPTDQETILHAARSMPPGGDIVGWDLIGQPGERMVIEGNSGSGLPTGAEGSDPDAVVASYARRLEDAARTSPLHHPTR